MQKIVPNLWFHRNAAEAAEFYRTAFPGTQLIDTTYYPQEGLPDFQRDFAGEVLTIDLEIAEFRFTLINAGDEFTPNPAISFMVAFDEHSDGDARQRLDETWAVLGEGGTELMPLTEYPFSSYYGWVQDRYGVSWQLSLIDSTDGAGSRPSVYPSLLFGGAAQNRAAKAKERYLVAFPDSADGATALYPEQTGPAPEGAVMYTDFQLEGQWFAAMDSGVEQDFTFTPGVSLLVNAADQAEIDRLWDQLSHVPEAEQCGWCTDEFGVSWQIVPANMNELMNRDGGYAKLMDMKKIEIDRF